MGDTFIPRSERWGEIMYNADLVDKAREKRKIRKGFFEEYKRASEAPEVVENPQIGNLKRLANGSVYKWNTLKNTKSPKWMKVSEKFGYHTNLGTAIALENKHGFRYNKLKKRTQTRKNRKNRRAAQRRH